jgi:hypothetical protein
MGKSVSALIAGLVFGLGLTISEMVNPAKVLAFLDIFGNWDPSLAFVMGAALAVTAIGYRLAWRRAAPVFAESFQVPGNRAIDSKLVAGSILFGAGWGLVGLCPGPALTALSFGGPPAWAFLAAMTVGTLMFDLSALAARSRPNSVRTG